jgi:nucleotide-binding universal stress UspA family protein
VVDAPAAAAALASTLWADARTLLADRGATVATRHVAYETRAVVGEPAGAIVATARARGAGTIVMGTHGRRGVQRMFLGSVADAVVRAASVPAPAA